MLPGSETRLDHDNVTASVSSCPLGTLPNVHPSGGHALTCLYKKKPASPPVSFYHDNQEFSGASPASENLASRHIFPHNVALIGQIDKPFQSFFYLKWLRMSKLRVIQNHRIQLIPFLKASDLSKE